MKCLAMCTVNGYLWQLRHAEEIGDFYEFGTTEQFRSFYGVPGYQAGQKWDVMETLKVWYESLDGPSAEHPSPEMASAEKLFLEVLEAHKPEQHRTSA